jgi:PAS domain S-box-containing protein
VSAEWRFDELHPDAFRMLVEGVPAVLYIDRPDDFATNLYTSPQVETMLGFSVEEWTTDAELWSRQLHPEDRDRAMAEHFESNRNVSHYLSEYRFICKDGRTVWIRDEAVPVRGPDGTLLYWRGVMLDITERKEAEEKLRWSLEVLRKTLQQRRELAQRLQNAQEAERRRIAADLHDDPIQVMSAVDMRLQMLSEFPDSVTNEQLSDIEADVRGVIERLRSMLFELRPTSLDREGLAAALKLYLEHTAKSTGWEIELNDALSFEPEPDLRALLYRLAQEAVVNVRKHAEATRVRIDLADAADGITLRVQDDGKGFTPEASEVSEPGHLGLSTMVERAELAGGWARISSSPGAGTTMECWLPLDAAGDKSDGTTRG